MRVVHVISGLGRGGAERMLARLCIEHHRQGLAEPIVVSLGSIGPIGEDLRQAGVRVEALGMARTSGAPAAALRLRRLLRKLRPAIVQTWLYHADLMGGLTARGAGTSRVVWNIRCTDSGSSRATRWLVRLNAMLSRKLPASIVCCGKEAARFHAALGYDAARMTVLPNCFEVDHFPTPLRGDEDPGCRFLVIGRDEVLKDYFTLICAFARIAESEENRSLVVQLGLESRVTLGPPPADRCAMVARVRKRVANCFEIGHVALLYVKHYSSLIAQGNA